MKTGRKTWAFEVRQLDKHADLWVREIQEAIERCVCACLGYIIRDGA